MRSNPRCVFDTNVLVSALLFDHSTPAQAFFAALHAGEIIEQMIRACRDPKDDKFLELAVNGEADCIVSEDLLSLDPFRGIPILTSDKFLDALSNDRSEEKWHTPARIALAGTMKEGQQHSTHSPYLGHAPGVHEVREAAL